MYVLNSLMPVFLVIALGKILCRTGFFSESLAKSLNRITYWIALPALLIDKISNATFSGNEVSRISLLLILATAASALFSYLTARLLRMKRHSTGAFMQGSFRSNNAFVGLPVILYSMTGLDPKLEALATVALAPAIVFYNVLSISVLLAYSDKEAHPPAEAARLFTRQLLSNPLLIACLLGLALNFFGLGLPTALQRSLTALGNSALALALLSIGAALSFSGLKTGLGHAVAAAGIKVFIQPLIGLALALLWNIPPIERQILLVYLACPAAVASYVLADIFGSDRDLAAHIIVISTLLSIVSLSLVVAFGG